MAGSGSARTACGIRSGLGADQEGVQFQGRHKPVGARGPLLVLGPRKAPIREAHADDPSSVSL